MASTPMYEQYQILRKKYSDCILLFRLGDFYEAFDEDAQAISKVLGMTLTGRGKGENRIPMAGMPHHALKQYLPKLVRHGYKIAIAEQLEPATVGKLVKREVVRVITAGTLLDENMLEESQNNYLATLYYLKKLNKWGLAYTDLSTGEFMICEYSNDSTNFPRMLMQELYRIRPAEILLDRTQAEQCSPYLSKFTIQLLEHTDFDYRKSERVLLEGLKVKSLKPFGIDKHIVGIITAGVLYQYLLDTQKTSLEHIKKIQVLPDNEYMNLDGTTIRSLELFYSLSGSESNTLFSCLNKCKTAMGQRLLRSWLLRPLLKKEAINHRFDNVTDLYENEQPTQEISQYLAEIIDTERLLSRLATGNINAKDLLFLSNSLQACMAIINKISNSKLNKIKENLPKNSCIDNIDKIIKLIEKSIKDDPGLTITEGNMIRAGYDPELDEVNKEAEKGKIFIKSLQEKERAKTGITTLKVGFNQIFGYYIEVSKGSLSKVPASYIRKQTLVNAERFITEELKYWEDKVLNAQTRAAEIEYRLFEDIRDKIIAQIEEVQRINSFVALIDVYVNFAQIAKSYNLIRPEITDDTRATTEIKDSRHIVVELSLQEQFIPNDVSFKPDETEIIILTGPNMSGKSTYIRQVALLFIMTQLGCYIPAKYARIVLTDRIFTRIGSADNLAGGESTFMVEMNETANILNNATEKSIIILDEIGRGTSTYDGLALAWAIVEHLAKNIRARTLFATHYHELMLLESKMSTVKNYNVQVKEQNGEVLFMHKIVPGSTDRSYGIYVAQISGIPKTVISRADDILEELENEQLNRLSEDSIDYQDQLSFGTLPADDIIKTKIKEIDLNKLTPIDALLKIKQLQEDIQNMD